ncbi:MAG: hypothetical protein ABR521_06540 [Gaiellaceae bacterium]
MNGWVLLLLVLLAIALGLFGFVVKVLFYVAAVVGVIVLISWFLGSRRRA